MKNAFENISTALGKKTIFLNIPLWFGVFTARVLFFMSLGSINCIEIIQRM
jgi:hypothetical protein